MVVPEFLRLARKYGIEPSAESRRTMAAFEDELGVYLTLERFTPWDPSEQVWCCVDVELLACGGHLRLFDGLTQGQLLPVIRHARDVPDAVEAFWRAGAEGSLQGS